MLLHRCSPASVCTRPPSFTFASSRLPTPVHPLSCFCSPILVHRLPALVHCSCSRSPPLPRLFTTVHTHWLPLSSPPCCIPPPSPFSLGPARLCTSHSWLHRLVRPCAFVLLWCVFRCEMAVGDAGWWWVWVKDREVTEGQCIRQCKACEGGDLTKVQKPSI